MKQTFPRAVVVWLAAGWCMVSGLHAQSLPQLENDSRNIFSLQPSTDWPPPAPGLDVDPRVPSANQWRSGSVYGGWQTHRIPQTGPVLAGPTTDVPGDTSLIYPHFTPVDGGGAPIAGEGVALTSVVMGRAIVGRAPTVFFGDIIARPSVDENGQPVSDPVATYLPEPDNWQIPDLGNPGQFIDNPEFYYSSDARLVFATQAGVINVTWRFRDPAHVPSTLTLQYVVSSSPAPGRETRRMFWTEKGFKGPLVLIPSGPIAEVKIRYSTEFPEVVPTEYPSPYTSAYPQTENLKTLWWESADGRLHAHNKEGRVFVEFLGAKDTQTDRRQYLGSEVVEVIREVSPAVVNVSVGDRILPHDGDTTLIGSNVNGIAAGFVHRHTVTSNGDSHYYAVRTTTPTVPAGNPTGEIVFYWMRKGQLDLVWPRYYDTYVSTWPDPETPDAYTQYVRANTADGDASATGILLDTANQSALVFQNDPSGQHASLDGGNLFYTQVSPGNPTGYALIRHQNGDSIWFERVYSLLNSDFPGYDTLTEVEVGQRIEPPPGYEAALGYIRREKATEGFRPAPFDADSYKDPFVDGVQVAKQGAIIPVNARETDNKLEIWWYKQTSPPVGSTLKPNYVPVSVNRYQIHWPESPDKIVLASNEGTDDLPSYQASGSIYYENDDTEDGFNPNDEHALMLAGRAYALRDDLGTALTSRPYVLLRYSHPDGRPAMRVFQVLREDLENDITFEYEVVAGRVLQAPMPLPVMPPVTRDDGSPANIEVKPAKEATPDNLETPQHYRRYTYTDRKGTVWLYRGPHVDEDPASLLEMQYYYPSQEGFYIPGLTLAQQPAVGTAMPYLREAKEGAPEGEDGYNGNRQGLNDQALKVAFSPQWPDDAPVLLFGETLTTPNRGLPAVRGQTSAEVLYDQALAATADAKSATLFDPTVAKSYALTASTLNALPGSVFTNSYRGKTYFPNLPPHLVERFYFDPNQGAKGSLVLLGQFKDEVFGDDYLLLNVLSDKDKTDLKELCQSTDADRGKWVTAIDGLQVVMAAKVENADKKGSFIQAKAYDLTKTNKIWTYISGRNWTATATTPTSGTLRTNASLQTTDDVNNALQWIRENLSDLIEWSSKKGLSNLSDREKSSLNSAFEADFLTSQKPLGSRGWYYYNTNWIEYDRITPISPAFKSWIVNTARNWSDTSLADGYIALDAATWTVTPTAGDLIRAKHFIKNYYQRLKKWDEGMDGFTDLSTIATSLENDFKSSERQAYQEIAVGALAEVTHKDFPVDSYALTAEGGGEGWVVMIYGNSRSLSPQEEPVSISILRVSNPLGRGELKVIQPSNPLSEKLTLQHSHDFAGTPEKYDFEWRTLPPLDGQPPIVYTFTSSTVLGAVSETWSATTGGGATNNLSLPGQVPANTGDAMAVIELRKSFTMTELPYRAFFSMAMGALDGVRISVNGSLIARKSVPNEADTGTVTPPLPSFSPLTYVYEVPVSLLKLGANANTILIEPFSSADLGSPSLLNARLEVMNETDQSGTWQTVGVIGGEMPGLGGSVIGRNRYVIEGNSLFTLTDNYFICRYRARSATPQHAAYDVAGGWSKWTSPQLAEGWIKRALAGINPFEQRLKDLYNNDINTDVSLVTQAGKRWEGDVALNLENINDFGLIEIYETILRRGKSLSIEGAPAINYGPANDALLLAAGYLNDLYMLLGNEASSDASNPTIAFSTNAGEFGDVATSLFAFKGQQASVLDEELALLRGRDDFLSPGSRLRPVFNRLIWNYTRGIDNGEAVYALNYNIKDLDADGTIGAADAAQAYPQGHGDAYGHYLTAVKNYYTLLWNPQFSWTPRVEAVSLLGQPVTVDYLDERKFAGAAAAWTKAAAQVVDLTYRADYNPAVETNRTWTHLTDGRVNTSTSVRRDWGVDDWAARGGQGAYFHWLTANSMLPEVDPNPAHEGIQKIDRTTVPEIAAIVAQNDEIQRSLDRANAGLNPLGLAAGAVSFDISPSEVDQGKTHYEQVYLRAVAALSNAANSFNQAKNVTQLLRSQEDSLEERREAIYAQERAFEAQLTELYGSPYPEDIGPGKTYDQGYEGPDLVNYMYVDMPELQKNADGSIFGSKSWTYYLAEDTNFTGAMDNIDKWAKIVGPSGGTEGGSTSTGGLKNWKDFDGRVKLISEDHVGDNAHYLGEGGIAKLVTYTLDSTGNFVKPTEFTGQRAHPGQIQRAIGNVLAQRLHLHNALEDHDHFARDLGRLARTYFAAVDVHNTNRDLKVWNFTQTSTIEGAVAVLESVNEYWDAASDVTEKTLDSLEEAMPKTVGLAPDVTSAARAAIIAQKTTSTTLQTSAKAVISTVINGLQQTLNNLQRGVELREFDVAWYTEHLGLLNDLKAGFESLEDRRRTTDIGIRAYQNAKEELRAMIAKGLQIQDERAATRRRAAAIIQGYRTKDLGFRAFRNEALESYKSLFDLASRYTYLAARSYDYETGLVNASGSSTANSFYQSIIRSRAVGVFANGAPQIAGSTGGDAGLSGALARMNSDWSVVKSRFGFNNPDRYRTTFSLRREASRILPDVSGDPTWKDLLAASYVADLKSDDDVKRYCLNINPAGSLSVPGFVIEFSTNIHTGYNFFGQALASGDSTFSPSSFATKIRTSGIAFPGYIGMASPTTVGGPLAGTGSTSPNDPGTGFTDPNGLSATPYIYLIPVGLDSIRAPAPSDTNIVRSWQVEDQAIPLPFDIGGAFSGSNLTGLQSLTESFTLRKHQAFRAVPDGTVFSASPGFTNSRLIGRSVWNSKWKLVIPGHTLHANPTNGLKTFQNTVKDILLYFESYSYSGN